MVSWRLRAQPLFAAASNAVCSGIRTHETHHLVLDDRLPRGISDTNHLPVIAVYSHARDYLSDDTLGWMLAFGGPFLIAGLLAITITVEKEGASRFLCLKRSCRIVAGDPRRRSSSCLHVRSRCHCPPALIAWPYFETPPEIGPQQTGLPTLHLARTLKASGGPRLLAWSADGERLAAYSRAGINTRESGQQSIEKEFSSSDFLTLVRDVLHYLSGHRLLITSAVAEVNSAEGMGRLRDMAFSVFDTEAGKVLQDVPGPHPGGRRAE